ncbi:unnamed protein product [Meganyctiphanes norvegica]|uniref:Exoribonuclease phosphorolytic domain-containing protein n=1 Tax=Meganyctiphanes norvegica TaxID=48144 RepID=A0AAV2RH08_MEGNR
MSVHTCDLNFLSRSDGSGLYTLGNTVVLASVNGPGDVKFSNRHYNKTHLEVVYSPRTGQSMITERAIEALIRRTVEQVILIRQHPRTAVNLTVQEMQDDGLTLACALNASCMALMDAGVQMKTTFAAVTASITNEGTIIIEPTLAQINESKAVITFVFEGQSFNVLATQQEGCLDSDDFNLCLNKLQVAAKDIFSFYRRTLEEKYLKIGIGHLVK